MGADILVIHGDRAPFRITDEEYIERFGLLAERGMEFGVRVAQENVALHRSASPEFIEKMRKTLGELAFFVFDFKQSIRSGCTYEQVIRAMGERLIHVHVNDSKPENDCVLPGYGDTDFIAAKQLIESYGCNPKWIIEVYRRCFGEHDELSVAAKWLNTINL